jgi:hypothetical protein
VRDRARPRRRHRGDHREHDPRPSSYVHRLRHIVRSGIRREIRWTVCGRRRMTEVESGEV